MTDELTELRAENEALKAERDSQATLAAGYKRERDAARAGLTAQTERWSKHRSGQALALNALSFRVQRWKARSLEAAKSINEAIAMFESEGDQVRALAVLRDAIGWSK